MKTLVKRFLYRLLYVSKDVQLAISYDNYDRMYAAKPEHLKDIFKHHYLKNDAKLFKI